MLTTPRAPEQAVLDGTRVLLGEAGLSFAAIGLIVHGTTLATNAIIERKGARAALIGTQGFRDVIEIADEGRFDQYDLGIEKPRPLVPRDRRFTVPERMDVHGRVRLSLDETAVRAIAARLVASKIEAVAVALIHAYANADHERRIGAILAEACPGLAVSLSSQVCPEAREYERTSTTVANAYVQPLMAGYLARLARAFAAEGCGSAIHLMTSGGTLASLDTAMRFPVRLIESGPAGGAVLAGRLAQARGEAKILSFDMGGTTAKICLIENGTPVKARTFEVDRQARFMKGSGLPVRIPVIEMVEIGAGGGSIARRDGLGRVLVGPDSAGSEPGPACYGRGGTAATVTDADVVLGKIDPAHFAGGRIALDTEAAAAALRTAFDRDAVAAALGVAEIVDENMANAARVHAVERGESIAERTLIAFGGAAPLHASRLAEKLGIGRIIVPAGAGVGSAIGFLEAPAAYEIVRSRYMRLDAFDAGAASALIAEMAAEAHRHAKAAAGGRTLVEQRAAFMRYAGQGHEIAIALPLGALAARHADDLRAAFETEYARLFARHIPHAAIEIMSWLVSVATETTVPPRIADAPPRRPPASAGTRSVHDAGLGRTIEVTVFARDALAPGMRFDGPALIVEDGTSTYVSPRFDCAVDAGHALVLTARARTSGKDRSP